MKWLAMVAVLGLASWALAAAADYVIQLNRPMKAGAEFHISAVGKETTKESRTTDGKAMPDDVSERSIALDGTMKVLEVYKNGQPSKVIVTVEKCLIRLGADEKPLAKGTVITGTAKDGKDVFEVGGKTVNLNEILGLVIDLGKGGASNDEVFGTKDRKKVGDSWAMNSVLAASEAKKAGFNATQDNIKGTASLEKVVKVGETECLQLKHEMSVTGFSVPLPPTMKLEKGTVSMKMGGLYPVDTSKGPLEESTKMTMILAIKGKPKADGPEVATEMTTTKTCKTTYTYPK
jgi:hypothetical protein